MEGQIRTAQAEVGAEADGVYLSSLSVAALVAEGARLHEAQQYEQALAVYETAAARPEGRHLRVLNGLYLEQHQARAQQGRRAGSTTWPCKAWPATACR